MTKSIFTSEHMQQVVKPAYETAYRLDAQSGVLPDIDADAPEAVLTLGAVLPQSLQGNLNHFVGGEPEGMIEPDRIRELLDNYPAETVTKEADDFFPATHGFAISHTKTGLTVVGAKLEYPLQVSERGPTGTYTFTRIDTIPAEEGILRRQTIGRFALHGNGFHQMNQTTTEVSRLELGEARALDDSGQYARLIGAAIARNRN